MCISKKYKLLTRYCTTQMYSHKFTQKLNILILNLVLKVPFTNIVARLISEKKLPFILCKIYYSVFYSYLECYMKYYISLILDTRKVCLKESLKIIQ